ncbi:invasion associated locus B family protein [Paracoccus tegillarcae]|uniref:Invasion associated locus B family protein n=1 Tax=Paracoccus tegillarcae TaxID=1529068 RepID=A0A2K9EQ71_9RHOB|nr:invasion associated locus B family protein [Paracoccus tegillarcae]AUH33815.1 hypothetical protein CUV01_10815 [Paracoccus tegillarcae]
MRHVLISALFAVTLPLAVSAQEAPDTSTPSLTASTTATEVTNGQAFGDWTVRCEALGVNRTRCMLSQTITVRDSGALLADLLAFWTEDERQIMIAQAPVGVHLPSGFVLQAEGAPEEERMEFVWQACNGQICEAAALPEQADIDRLTAAERVLAGYRPSAGSEPTVFPISTDGLVEGLAALKPAAAAE